MSVTTTKWQPSRFTAEVACPFDLKIHAVRVVEVDASTFDVEVYIATRDLESGGPLTLTFHTRYSTTAPLTVSDLQQIVRRAVARVVVHEVDEQLTFNSVRLTDPHAEDYKPLVTLSLSAPVHRREKGTAF